MDSSVREYAIVRESRKLKINAGKSKILKFSWSWGKGTSECETGSRRATGRK